MPVIRVLPDSVANQIAAGEVVEAPASVVKELVENSLDAGASRVRIEITGGGLGLIRISDDGCGIARDEVTTAFARHGTSKLVDAEELWSIRTLGFRGEALPSIASVAKVDLATRRPADIEGSEITVLGGEISPVVAAGVASGTTISVRELFYNTPARLKFLKSQASESARIASVVTGLALAHPEVAFSLLEEGREVVNTPGRGGIRAAAGAILGARVAKELLPVEHQSPFVTVDGMVGPPGLARGNRSLELFFVNGRVVQSRMLSTAVEKAFGSLLPLRRFPLVMLDLNLSPDQVDVNVHPTKREVRFRHEGDIYRATFSAAKNALGELPLAGGFALPRMGGLGLAAQEQPSHFAANAAGAWQSRPLFTGSSLDRPDTRQITGISRSAEVSRNQDIPQDLEVSQEPEACQSGENFEPTEVSLATAPSPTDSHSASGEAAQPVRFRYLGQFAATYLVVEMDAQLILVDQHAAHERVIYDGLTARRRVGGGLVTQQLLIPQNLELTPEEAQLMRSVLPGLVELGLEVEEFGLRSFIVRSVPAILAKMSPAELLTNALNEVAAAGSTGGVFESLWQRVLASIACKGAIKAGQALSSHEAQALLEAWSLTDSPWTCPHGRPVGLAFGIEEISKRFLRGGVK